MPPLRRRLQGDGRVFGEVCSAFCHIGWRIEGNASVIVCDVVDNESQGFVQYFESNGSHMPVQQTAGPRCVPVECTQTETFVSCAETFDTYLLFNDRIDRH